MLKKFLIGTLVGVALLAGASVAQAYDFGTTTLKVGSSGPYVVTLQTLVGATADGSFGPLTQAKVMAWQANNGLTADGVFGPVSKAKANAGGTVVTVTGCPAGALFNSMTGTLCSATTLPAGCTSTVGYSSTTGLSCAGTVVTYPAGCTSTAGFSTTTGLSCGTAAVVTGAVAGTSGEIADINQLSQYNAEEVGSGSENIKVLGFDVEASADGDITINTLKLTFDSTGNDAGDSDRLIDYLTNVYVWQGSTKIASMSTANFNKDSTGVYSKTFTLSNSVVKASKIEKFYVSVDAVVNLDSGDIAGATEWSVAINNLRYTDGLGITTTVDSADGLLAGNMDYDAAGDGVNIEFVTFSTAADTELKISADSTPVAQVVKVSATAQTDDVVLLKGKMKLLGTSDVWLDELPITLTTTGDSISALTANVTLTIDGKKFTESTGANCVLETALWVGADNCDATTTAGILFDNLNLDIIAGSTIYFTVSADMNDINNDGVAATDFDEGDTLLASLTGTVTTGGRASMVVENSQGESLTDVTERTGSAVGYAQTLRSTGITVVLVGTPTITVTKGLTTAPDLATGSITFDVTAFGGDMYVDGTKPTLAGTNSADVDITPGTGGTGTQDAVIASSTSATMTGTINTTARFAVLEGITERFTITSVITPTVAGGLYSVALTSLPYGSADADVTDALVTTGTAAWEYTTGLDDFKTPSANLVLVN